jgi:hypothetical protein
MTADEEGRAEIRTPDQRLRVFVSSTLAELADERAAVARAIQRSGLFGRHRLGRTRPRARSSEDGIETTPYQSRAANRRAPNGTSPPTAGALFGSVVRCSMPVGVRLGDGRHGRC